LNLLSETLGATVQQQPKSWLIASDGVSEGGRPAILAASGQVNVAWAARVSSDAAARDPQAEALQTILGVQRDLLAADSFAVPLMQSQAYEGEFLQKSVARRAAELASNRTQVPMLAGADLGEGHSPGAPLLLVSSAVGAIFSSQAQGVKPGDRLGWLATGVFGPASLEDPVSQRKWVDALREAQLKGLFSGLRSSGPLPALWAAVQLARQAGGALVSPPVSQLGEFLSRKESLMVAVRPDRWAELKAHLEAWGIQLTGCGSFDSSGKLELHRGSEIVASTSLSFLWEGGPKRKIEFSIQTPRSAEVSQPDHPPFKKSGDQMLVRLLALPEVRSPERMLQAFDLEAQAHSVLKPLHSVSVAEGGWVNGPNDGAVIMVNPPSERLVEASSGEDLPMLALALGASVRPTAPSASWRAWMSVDEAIRNLVCTGAQVGADETLCALSVQWKGESPERHPGAAAELVETLEALREASVALGIPIVTAAASFSTQPMSGTLVCHALGRLRAVRWARSSDFKSPSDAIYVLGPDCQTLAGSLFAERYGARSEGGHASGQSASSPDWPTARKIYGWLGGVLGKEQGRVRSLHDISEGGLLVAVTEAIVARGLGAALRMPDDLLPEAWAFGEGFHRILTSCSEADSSILESEWNALGIPYRRLGSVTSSGRLEIIGQWSVPVAELRKAWRSEEVWA
jgi:phosphoribosylformylglycinamidine synthase